MNIKNSILKPFLITFLILLFLLVATFSVLHFFFPLNLSNWFYSMGANNLAVNYLERSYEKTKDYDQLYSLVNLSIKTDKYEKVEKYFEKFFADKNYNNFVLNVDAQNLTQNVSNLVKSSLYSEDNYLKKKYVLALVKQNKVEKAFEFAKANSPLAVTLDDLGVYSFTHIFEENVDLTNLNLTEFANNLESYFEENINLFNTCADENNLLKIKGLVLGTRINEIAINLKTIKNFNAGLISLTNEEINNKVLLVSKTMTMFV